MSTRKKQPEKVSFLRRCGDVCKEHWKGIVIAIACSVIAGLILLPIGTWWNHWTDEQHPRTDGQHPQKIEEASVTMAQFFRELEQEGAAPFIILKRYVGKRVTWEGYFDHPADASCFPLKLYPDNSSPDIFCWFPDDAKEELLTLRKGCKVKVSGILESKEDLKNCKLLAIEEAPPKAKQPKATP
jgi:hypothetical protein